MTDPERFNAIRLVAAEVASEVSQAMNKFPAFHSAHEGWAFLKEEVDELWDEVKKKRKIRDHEKLRYEAIQCAAMAIQFVIDCEGDK